MFDHDHSKCTTSRVDGDLISSLPFTECGDQGHDAAVGEAGYCPVCQH